MGYGISIPHVRDEGRGPLHSRGILGIFEFGIKQLTSGQRAVTGGLGIRTLSKVSSIILVIIELCKYVFWKL